MVERMPRAPCSIAVSLQDTNPGHKKSHSLSGFFLNLGAGNETRTRDPDLGKVVLYQLSYSRVLVVCIL